VIPYINFSWLPGVLVGLDLPERHPLQVKDNKLTISQSSIRLFVVIFMLEFGLCKDIPLEY
jgi:hypothetical protein